MAPKLVLYNPRAVFWTMPLALLAVGSALARRRVEQQDYRFPVERRLLEWLRPPQAFS